MYHSHIIKPQKIESINQPALYEGIPSLSFKEGRIASFEETKYKHNYKPVIEGHNLLLHKGGLGQNYRKHRA